jgi:hypothetical protein
MVDIKLTEDGHDIQIDGTDITLINQKFQDIRQKIIIKIRTYQGEWFLNQFEGIPYYQSIVGKNRSKETIDAIFKRAILSTEGVKSLVFFRSNITSQREYVVQFQAETEEGYQIEPITIDGFQL